ncbi:coproporphyrinogen-III oxidase family protein [Bacillus thuringiensis]|uniref:Heme chaperone HemW n=2 Tax=Bacillus thuringiensis TaxID=1428 RepID=A0ABD5HY43_BACTU|nr:radical SAM protein [Bacillus thuringiensis]MCR6779857.1 radical SAM protein [Bacillus thuringiensis]MCR6857926.1 radical SAM protein [Bacillus thuringiensis]MCR6866856.1 radical SAM protein [Bacillus thuringiensis]MDW9209891.1 radical SAM protein [Bacillus thuringiensis serovar toumanoffi]MED2620530.1 radical SAM protein [Bacillus thuringiensis]
MNIMQKIYPEHPMLWNFLYPFFGEDSVENAQSRVENMLRKTEVSQKKGKTALYLHIPFCDTICSFCPFIKSTKYEPIIGEYVECLIKEMELLSSSPVIQALTFDVIFVGGGTPSVLTPTLIEKLTTAINKNFKLSPDYEWTFECEAKTADEERIAAMAAGGANRGSFGVQTLNPKYRKLFNLTSSYEQIQHTVETMKRYFKSYNLDLLYQLPGQSEKELIDDLNAVMELGTTSIDAYPLEYIACSKGWLNKITKGSIPRPPTPAEKIKYNRITYDHFRNSGWNQKYVYTFMAPGHEEKRFKYGEIIYGGYEDQCIGLGTGAVTYMQGITWANEGNTQKYIEQIKEHGLAVAKSRLYHAYDRRFIFFPKTMRLEKYYIEEMPEKDKIIAKLNSLVHLEVVVEEKDCYILKEEAKPWYPAILVDLIPANEKVYFDKSVNGLQKQLNWYEPVGVEV